MAAVQNDNRSITLFNLQLTEFDSKTKIQRFPGVSENLIVRCFDVSVFVCIGVVFVMLIFCWFSSPEKFLWLIY